MRPVGLDIQEKPRWARAVQHRRLVDEIEFTTLRDRAFGLLHESRIADALPLLDRILAAHPDDQDSISERALSLSSLASTTSEPTRQSTLRDRALADASSLIALSPRSPSPLRLKAHLVRHMGRADEADRLDHDAAGMAEGEPTDFELQLDQVDRTDRSRGGHGLDAS
jgi:hypothetical protein